MISKNEIKLIKSLSKKKYRQINGLFVVEGQKNIEELLNSKFEIQKLFSTQQLNVPKNVDYIQISDRELNSISGLQTPNQSLAIVKIPNHELILENLKSELTIVLENLQDPGNLGTIIRIANWFGIKNIICSKDSVDCFNPKVVQSTMGAIFRINVLYEDIYQIIKETKTWNNFNNYATTLKGENIYDTKLNNNGIIIMGNESQGISNKLLSNNLSEIKIPSFYNSLSGMESLNVGVATGIVCSEFRRQSIK